MNDEWLWNVLHDLCNLAEKHGLDYAQPHLEAALEAATRELKPRPVVSLDSFRLHSELLARTANNSSAPTNLTSLQSEAEGRREALILVGPWQAAPKSAFQ